MQKRRLLFVLLIILLATAAYADVVISEFRGKVEIRSPGDSWRTAEVGMSVLPDDTISTGFNSTAVLSLGANNVIVSPLTRMTIDRFLERETAVDTTLFLQVGAVRAQVDDSGAKQQRFSISSPYSTASVRGTEFEFDGLNLKVVRGTVALILGPPRRPTRTTASGGATGGEGEGDGQTEGEGDGGDQGTGDQGTGDQDAGDQGGGDQGTGDQGGGDQGTETGGTLVSQGQSITVDIDFSAGTTTTTRGGPGEGFSTDPTSTGGSGGGTSASNDDGGGGGTDGGTPVVTPTPPPATRGKVVVDWEWED
jgi:hypothetical protein